MKLIRPSFAAVVTTTAFIGLSKQSFGFVTKSAVTCTRHYSTSSTSQKTSNLLRMTSTTTPDVSRFQMGERPSETKDYIMQQVQLIH